MTTQSAITSLNRGNAPTTGQIEKKAKSNSSGAEGHIKQKISAEERFEKDKMSFIKMFLEQLKNQDPSNAQDSNQFAQQIASFTQVEQHMQSNKYLEKLVELNQGAKLDTANGYIGKVVDVEDAGARLERGSAVFNYSLREDADSVMFNVVDKQQNVVFSNSIRASNQDGKDSVDKERTIKGAHQYVWNGLDNKGNRMKEGDYEIQVKAFDRDGAAISAGSYVKGAVSEAVIHSGKVMLVVDGKEVSLDKVISISGAKSSSDIGNVGSVASSNITHALAYQDKMVEADYSNLKYNGVGMGRVDIGYHLPSTSQETTINILDRQNKLVHSIAGDTSAGNHIFKWDGKDQMANPLPKGMYKAFVVANSADKQPILAEAVVKGRVTGVKEKDGGIFLAIGNINIPIEKVSSVLNSSDVPSKEAASDAYQKQVVQNGLNSQIEQILKEVGASGAAQQQNIII